MRRTAADLVTHSGESWRRGPRRRVAQLRHKNIGGYGAAEVEALHAVTGVVLEKCQ